LIEVRTPCRLHFGLLAFSRTDSRQFGGVGLMIEQPDIVVRVSRDAEPRTTNTRRGSAPPQRASPSHASPSHDPFTATGPMAARAAEFARRFARLANERRLGTPLHSASIHVVRHPRPHTGLGTGTQLGMAVARALAELIGRDDLGPHDLADLVGRGRRSAIGTHGFFHGGFIVEGGKRRPGDLSPMVLQQPFPDDWRIVLITPTRLTGINGEKESHAFQQMQPIPQAVTDRMCRLTLLGLVPALIERDLPTFSQSLFDLQQQVGACFAAAQSGVYADPMLAEIVSFVRGAGVSGVGQSSWGPTLYAVVADEQKAQQLATQVRHAFDLSDDEVLVTAADNQGSTLRHIEQAARQRR
jgi:beta-RFAP synthase